MQFAARYKCIVVLKGHRSLITDGDHNELNETGNPGMATGGTGDVLTGVIAALWAKVSRRMPQRSSVVTCMDSPATWRPQSSARSR